MKLSTFIEHLKKSEDIGSQIVFHHYLSPQKPKYMNNQIVSPDIMQILEKRGIEMLYSHQTEAIEKLKHGNDILVSTPTASG
ncbi:MAG TPA: hypothetical protein VMW42_08580, partial [Desulfatiglandales bacterium]|nr:hypothetical protein [Desulfatiglandales bacterium]